MNVLHLRFFVSLICFLFYATVSNAYGQTPKDSGVVDVSEILIPQCEKIKHQKNLYYEVYTSQDNFPSPSYWYKIMFVKDCSFRFSLFPFNEEDTYDLFCFKLSSNADICNSITNKNIVSCNAQRVYKDFNDEEVKIKSESKFIDVSEVFVKAGDAIYIEIFSTKGKDCGHILEFKTTSSFFVSKLINRKCPSPEKYSTDATIPAKPYQTIQTEEEAIDILNKTFCEIKKNELLITSINVSGNNATFNAGLDFVSYERKTKKEVELVTPLAMSNPISKSEISTKTDSTIEIKKDESPMPNVKPDTVPKIDFVLNLPTDSTRAKKEEPTKTNNESVKNPSSTKSTADLSDNANLNKQTPNNNNSLRHSRLLVDNTLFSTLLDEIEGKIEGNEKQLKAYAKQLKKANKEEKAEINVSIKQLKQQNIDLKVKLRDIKARIKTIEKLLEKKK